MKLGKQDLASDALETVATETERKISSLLLQLMVLWFSSRIATEVVMKNYQWHLNIDGNVIHVIYYLYIYYIYLKHSGLSGRSVYKPDSPDTQSLILFTG